MNIWFVSTLFLKILNVSTRFFLQKYFIANYDGYTLDLSTIPDMTANVTTIRLLNPDNIAVNEYPNNPKLYMNQMTVRVQYDFWFSNRFCVTVELLYLFRQRPL